MSGAGNRLAAGVAVALIGMGCAAMSPTQIGQTTGSIAGGAIVPGIGVPLGALVGTLAGLVVERHIDKAREQKERADLGEQLRTVGPPATGTRAIPSGPVASAGPSGPPTRVWVDESLGQGRLVAGHFESRVIP